MKTPQIDVKTLTPDQHEEAQLSSRWAVKFKEAMINKRDYTKQWQRYIDAYDGDYFRNKNRPDYKSDLVSNYIFSIIETIRPIMLDNNPRFNAIPRQPEAMEYTNDLNETLLYEWDREKMTGKMYRDLINTLRIGTSVYFLPWDSDKKNVRSISVNAFNIFPDPLATSVEDAEYVIYATYKPEGKLKQLFPNKAHRLIGSRINYSELVNDNDDNVQIHNQILVLEIWCRDWSTVVIEEEKLKKKKAVYPKGRVLTICPELNIVLSDKQNPYEDGKFPFILFKDYDIPGKFWGEGEVAQLISPQTYMNELSNAVIDNAKRTANMPWVIDKNAGIAQGAITDRPGLIIRKNPGSEVRRDAPPPLPGYIQQAISDLKKDMEQVSGVFDTVKGNNETGVYTAQGILALQEAGQARIRLKVKVLEESLSEMACLWYSRIKQFWPDDRWVRLTHADGSYDFKKMKKGTLDYEYDVKITAGSTMAINRGAMLDLMIRLAQTKMSDGNALVDREAVVNYLPEEVKAAILRRMGKNGTTLEVLQQELKQFEQQNQQDDQKSMDTINQLTGALEKINKEIVQLKDAHVKMMEKAKQDQVVSQVKHDSYNQGYGDAQQQIQTQPTDVSHVPDSVLHGLDHMTNDELKLLVDQNPDLVHLINKSGSN